ncbi:cation-translocating P-type ATPase [Modicisalibacter xianhensis]|uniref:Ca2+-transporting ATPase n=1 Tax=Modicisalibacter xianhensis TaxID=442341 RepID=A0A1I3CQX7_9GAMM|nr:HAD-IC family P-type ATPase [Halomonas xianhensis]SFH76887.1 Ca2+-transporting ATPase [Halomonas xianhensis]
MGSDGRQQRDWHATTCDEALLHTNSTLSGLSSEQARQRLAEHGPNQLRQAPPRPWWKRLLAQFDNLLMLILLVAAGVSLGLGEILDATAIAGVVMIIALIGFIQEGKAERAMEGIRGMLSPRASVIRDGKRHDAPAADLVPGDIVYLESGDRVPADIRLLETRRLRTHEAPLTGESVPVDKDTAPVDAETELAERSTMAYAGTLVAHGQGLGVVVGTGQHTEIGQISDMLQRVEKLRTPLLRQLDRAGRTLAIYILGAAIVTGLFGFLVHGEPLAEMFMASVGLAVAAIPEGLPAIVTIGLALGVQSMARRHAIVRRLPAVETLGAITTIFSDKTGTLTCNEMTVQALCLPSATIAVSGMGYIPEGEFRIQRDSAGDKAHPMTLGDHPALGHLLTAGVLCNDAALARNEERWQIHGDPTEGALLVVAAKAGLDIATVRHSYTRRDHLPFDAERRYMASLNTFEDGDRLLVKGAPDRLLDMCRHVAEGDILSELDHAFWLQRIHDLSSQGLRVLAIAEKRWSRETALKEEKIERDLVLLGLVGMLDPPRDEAIQAIEHCLAAGIRPIMVTGDHAMTAKAIAERLGFVRTDAPLTGRDIDRLDDTELTECIRTVDVFARVAPEHKLRLVKAMQANGGICAMTGDGVNDGPALKRADVGIAMGIQGTEAAKEAAEMVLADDNFATIVNAIEEGRKVYDNIRKTITFLLPTNGSQGLAILIAVLAGTLLPITPLQALWVNMVVAVTLGLALAFEKGEPDLMQRAPRPPNAPLLDLFLLWRVVFVSCLLLLCVFGMFAWLLHGQDNPLALARSGAVNMLVMGSAAYLINSRFLINSSLSWHGIFGSRPVWLAIGLVVLIQLGWTYLPVMQHLFESAPLLPMHWLAILLASVGLFLIIELEKRFWRKRRPAGLAPSQAAANAADQTRETRANSS